MSVADTIKEQVTTHPVVLYMKGTLSQPQCGFSANAVNVLNACGVEKIFAVDVLADPEALRTIRAGQRFHNFMLMVSLLVVRISSRKCIRTVSYKNCCSNK